MGYDELKNLSHEDLSLFEERLKAFFKVSVDDSFVRLRQHLQNRFSRFSNADELVDVTISRLIRKVAEYERRGERILDLRAFALRMASLIVHEFERAKKRAMPIDPDTRADTEATSPQKELRWYDTGHVLPPQASTQKHDWLHQQIGIDPRAGS